MIYYFPRLDWISYLEVTSPLFLVTFLRTIQMAFEKITMSCATCTILHGDYRAFLLHYMPTRNLPKLAHPPEASKMGTRIRKFQWWNWSMVPCLPQWRNQWFWLIFAHRYIKTRKGREIVTKTRSLTEFNRKRNTIIEGREKICNHWFSFLIVFLCMVIIAKMTFQIPRHHITITWCVGFGAHNRRRI